MAKNRDISSLHPSQIERFSLFLDEMRNLLDLDIRISEAFRDEEEQKNVYDSGNSYVLWPYSWHNWGLAIDIYNNVTGHLYDFLNDQTTQKIIDGLCDKYKITWGWRAWGFDKPHFMYTQGYDINQIVDNPDILNGFEPYRNEDKYYTWAESVGIPHGATMEEIRLVHSQFKFLEQKYNS